MRKYTFKRKQITLKKLLLQQKVVDYDQGMPYYLKGLSF